MDRIMCSRCQHPLTHPLSRRRGMGATCAARVEAETAADDQALLVRLEQLLTEAQVEGESLREIALLIAEVRAFPFFMPADLEGLQRVLDWHLTNGRTVQPIPAHLLGVVAAVVRYTGQRHLYNLLRREYRGISRAEAAARIYELAQVVPEAAALVRAAVGGAA